MAFNWRGRVAVPAATFGALAAGGVATGCSLFEEEPPEPGVVETPGADAIIPRDGDSVLADYFKGRTIPPEVLAEQLGVTTREYAQLVESRLLSVVPIRDTGEYGDPGPTAEYRLAQAEAVTEKILEHLRTHPELFDERILDVSELAVDPVVHARAWDLAARGVIDVMVARQAISIDDAMKPDPIPTEPYALAVFVGGIKQMNEGRALVDRLPLRLGDFVRGDFRVAPGDLAPSQGIG